MAAGYQPCAGRRGTSTDSLADIRNRDLTSGSGAGQRGIAIVAIGRAVAIGTSNGKAISTHCAPLAPPPSRGWNLPSSIGAASIAAVEKTFTDSVFPEWGITCEALIGAFAEARTGSG